MIHPFFSTLLNRPELLAEHASAYAELASAETALAASEWRRRGACTVTATLLALLGVGWGGVAALLAAAWPVGQMPAPWALLAVPAAPLLLALGVALFGLRRRRATPAFTLLRQQIAEDSALLRQGLARG